MGATTEIATDLQALPDMILTAAQVLKIVGVNRSTLFRWEQAGLFPRRVLLGKRRVGWLAREVLEWLEQRKADRGVLPPLPPKPMGVRAMTAALEARRVAPRTQRRAV